MDEPKVTDEGFLRLFKKRLVKSRWTLIAARRPEAHLMGEYRYAITRSPCCGRRLRVRIVQRAGKWLAEDSKRCPVCRQNWRIEALLTKNGIARSIRLYKAVKPPKIDP